MIIAIDTGGTKTLISGFSDEGKILTKVKIGTPRQTTKYLEVIEKILRENFGEEIKDGDVKAISIAVPAIVQNGVAVWAQNLNWRKFDIIKEFTKLFPEIKIIVENDANLAGLSEARLLENQDQTILYLTISTGIGSGIVTNKEINQGLRFSEPGRIMLEYDGVIREWEQFSSGKAIFNTYGEYAKDIINPKIWLNIADRISRGMLVVIPIIQPDMIILGGSIGAQFDKFDIFLRQLLQERLPENISCPKIIQAVEPEDAVIYGCYQMAKDELAK